jgi:threonine synthase
MPYFLIDLELLKTQQKQILKLREERDKCEELTKELSKQNKGMYNNNNTLHVYNVM